MSIKLDDLSFDERCILRSEVYSELNTANEALRLAADVSQTKEIEDIIQIAGRFRDFLSVPPKGRQ